MSQNGMANAPVACLAWKYLAYLAPYSDNILSLT